MKVSDYVIEFLVKKGLHDIFLASGGGVMHLLDAVGRHPEMNYYCNYHEQACAVAAEGYARVRDGVGVCLATVGPGAANALAGILGAWVDSVPLLVLSGQVRRNLMADFDKVRQFGPQEANVIAMAKPVTKYAATVLKPESVGVELERAWHAATTGRPGPAWLEFPLDVQGAEISTDRLETVRPPESEGSNTSGLGLKVKEVIALLRASKRPILICGNGIRRSRSQDLLRGFLNAARVPVLLPITAKDVLEEGHPMQMGVFGTAGQRRANFALQNSDFVLSLGAGLNCQKVGFNFAGFAPKAKKAIVDIDEGQLFRQVITPDVPVQCDVRVFLEEALAQLAGEPLSASSEWLGACDRWKHRYPPVTPDCFEDHEHVNSYAFMDRLSDLATACDVLVTGNGLDCASFYQGFRVKQGQRAMDSGWGSMGWDLPMAIGACVGGGGARTLCVTGDGSLQWNVQELLTLKRYRFPLKIFVFNNQGYQSIRATQNSFFEGRFVGADYSSGIDNPRYDLLAAAYDLGYSHIADHSELEAGIAATLQSEGPIICEVNLSPTQGISPKASAFRRPDGTFESRPLEDMTPLLPREEVFENMHLFDNS